MQENTQLHIKAPDEILSLILKSATGVGDRADPRFRATLMNVSRHFLAVVTSTPSLWTTIWEETPVDIVPVYVRRARNRPISLRLDLHSPESVVCAKRKIYYIEDRLTSLRVCGHVENVVDFLRACPLPSLEQARIGHSCTVECSNECQYRYTMGQLDKKSLDKSFRLTTLVIEDDLYIPHRMIFPNSITSLCIRRVPKLNALLHGLSALRNLEDLTIGHTSISGLDNPRPSQVSLSHLRKLDVTLDVGGGAAALFGSLSFPSSTRVKIGLFITPDGAESLDEDVRAAAQYLRSSSVPLLSIKALAHSRYWLRGTAAVRCFPTILTDSNGAKCPPMFSIAMWWRNPWPIPDRERVYRCILAALPLGNVQEVALCHVGLYSVRDGIEVVNDLGLADVPRMIPHASAILLIDPIEDTIESTVNLPLLKRIVTSTDDWHTLDRKRLGDIFKKRLEAGHPDITIDLLDTDTESFSDGVVESIASSSYIRDGVE
ncbi:hypothetical protein PENSPDRAFT_753808 [Peniophora sp. CONT]|nr:hypothetical protein PENSPDRAFT_753808 [Peniophora sp. CONT]